MTPAGRVTLWSPAAATMFGRTAAEAIGQDVRDVVRAEDHDGVLAAAIAGAAAGTACTRPVPVRLPGGDAAPVEFRCAPMVGAAGDITVAIGAVSPSDPVPDPAMPDGPRALTDHTILRIGASLDLRQTADELAGALVLRFGDTATVYILERLLVDDQEPSATEGESRIVVRRMALRASAERQEGWAAAFPGDEVVAYAVDTPFARCMSEDRPIAFDRLDAQTLRRIRGRTAARPELAELIDHGCFLAVPLAARGEVLGFAALARGPGRTPFDTADTRLIRDVADHAAVCMDNGRRYDRERRTAAILQHSLLPVSLPTPRGIRVAHRYLPASHTSHVGGDWYDAIPLPDDRLALVVGDAMGHGTTAALVMGQLRTAIRILARLNLEPAELLTRLDGIAQELTTAQFATCVYVVCDPARGRATVARAGHIPPVLAYDDGTSTPVDGPPGLPLGVAETEYEQVEIGLPEDGTLVLCTDGLVENRSRDVETGLAVLCEALADAPPDLEAACDAVLKRLRPTAGADDTTLLLARVDSN